MIEPLDSVAPGARMQKLSVAEFLQGVLAGLDNLPEGFEQRLVALSDVTPAQRPGKIRELLEDMTRG